MARIVCEPVHGLDEVNLVDLSGALGSLGFKAIWNAGEVREISDTATVMVVRGQDPQPLVDVLLANPNFVLAEPEHEAAHAAAIAPVSAPPAGVSAPIAKGASETP